MKRIHNQPQQLKGQIMVLFILLGILAVAGIIATIVDVTNTQSRSVPTQTTVVR